MLLTDRVLIKRFELPKYRKSVNTRGRKFQYLGHTLKTKIISPNIKSRGKLTEDKEGQDVAPHGFETCMTSTSKDILQMFWTAICSVKIALTIEPDDRQPPIGPAEVQKEKIHIFIRLGPISSYH